MDLKFYLNKFARIDNIEGYTLGTLETMRQTYKNFLDGSEGLDPDFPTVSFGGKGKKLNLGTNAYAQFGDEEDIPDDFTGLDLINLRKDDNSRIYQEDARRSTMKEREFQKERIKANGRTER